MSTGLVWEDPPSDGRGRTAVAHELIAVKLRQCPGKWARLTDVVGSGYIPAILTGKLKAYRPVGAYEALARNGSVYVRYVGESS